jgi:hypothetical protein
MTYNQYTTCVKAENHSTMNQYIQVAWQTLLADGIAALMIAAAALPWCLLLLIPITAAMGLIAYCHWWLEDRLICLGADKGAVGLLVSVEPPGEKSFPDSLDTDYSFSILPPQNLPGANQATVEASVPYGELIKEQAATKNIGVPFTGNPATDKQTGITSATLHCEFEGAGVRDALLGAQIALGLSVAGLIVCLGVPGPIGAIIAAVLALLALLAELLGIGIGLNDQGSPADVNPSLGDLHTNDHNGLGADLLGVFGTWVYDAGHNNEGKGWNEIHPIKMCTRIGVWKGSWPPDINDQETQWQKAVDDATSPATTEQQQLAQNQWQIHPVVDGCQPQTPPEPIK